MLAQGIGNSVAHWQPCFLVLSGLYLYVMESQKSQSYQRYLRFAFSIVSFLLLWLFDFFFASNLLLLALIVFPEVLLSLICCYQVFVSSCDDFLVCDCSPP